MILSTNIIDKEDDDKDSSSDDSIKDEGLTELKNIIEINRQNKEKEKVSENVNILGNKESSKNLTNIEFKNQSMNSSLKSLSHGEEFLQNDVLQVLNNPQKKKCSVNENQINDSLENSFHSKGSKNFILKSDYINNNSLHGSKKNLSSFVDINNNQNQKSLFFEQEEENFKKCHLRSTTGVVTLLALYVEKGLILITILIFVFLEWNIQQTAKDMRIIATSVLSVIILYLLIGEFYYKFFNDYRVIFLIRNILIEIYVITCYILLFLERMVLMLFSSKNKEEVIIIKPESGSVETSNICNDKKISQNLNQKKKLK